MKILYIIESLNMGGAENLVARLAALLNKTEEFEAVVCSLSGGYTVKKILEDNNIEYFVLNKIEGKDFTLFFKIYKLIKSLKVDIVHTHCAGPLLYSHIARCFMPNTLFVHTEHINPEQEVSYSKLFFMLNSMFMRSLDGFVSIAYHLTNYFTKKYKIKNMRTIQNGVNIEAFTKLSMTGSLKKELKLSKNSLIVGNVAVLRKQKDHATLIKAMKIITQKDPGIKLVIAGDGPLRQELQVMVQGMGLDKSVFFLGYCSNIEHLLAEFDIFAFSSLYEGLPLCLFEALAAGVPIVATDVSGNNEILTNEETGLLVPARDEASLALAILKIFNSTTLQEKLIASGKDMATVFDMKIVVKRYEQYYKNIARQTDTYYL